MTRGSRVDFAVNSLITKPKIIVFYGIVKIIPISPDFGCWSLIVIWLKVVVYVENGLVKSECAIVAEEGVDGVYLAKAKI